MPDPLGGFGTFDLEGPPIEATRLQTQVEYQADNLRPILEHLAGQLIAGGDEQADLLGQFTRPLQTGLRRQAKAQEKELAPIIQYLGQQLSSRVAEQGVQLGQLQSGMLLGGQGPRVSAARGCPDPSESDRYFDGTPWPYMPSTSAWNGIPSTYQKVLCDYWRGGGCADWSFPAGPEQINTPSGDTNPRFMGPDFPPPGAAIRPSQWWKLCVTAEEQPPQPPETPRYLTLDDLCDYVRNGGTYDEDYVSLWNERGELNPLVVNEAPPHALLAPLNKIKTIDVQTPGWWYEKCAKRTKEKQEEKKKGECPLEPVCPAPVVNVTCPGATGEVATPESEPQPYLWYNLDCQPKACTLPAFAQRVAEMLPEPTYQTLDDLVADMLRPEYDDPPTGPSFDITETSLGLGGEYYGSAYIP